MPWIASVSSRHVVSLVLVPALVLGLAVAIPAVAEAQCPGTDLGAASGIAGARSSATGTSLPPGPLWNFVDATTCSTSKVGAVTRCRVGYSYNPGSRRVVSLAAIWPSEVARTSDPGGGCNFMCDGGSCFVDTVGLPVELLGFAVE